MVRLYKEIATKILTCLLELKLNGHDLADVEDKACDCWYNRIAGNQQDAAVIQAIGSYVNQKSNRAATVRDVETIDDLINIMVKQLTFEQDSGDIIDALVETVRLPYARNVLSGKTIDELRKAILIPSEIVGLKDRLIKRELSCVSCGHEFTNAEIGVISKEDAGVEIFCAKCAYPTHVACVVCKRTTKLSTEILDLFDKGMKCNVCTSSRLAPRSDEDDEPDIDNNFDEDEPLLEA